MHADHKLAWNMHNTHILHRMEVNMKKTELLKKIAHLESVNDHLLTELGYVDHLMKLVGFTDGLETVKLTARELYEAEHENNADLSS